MFWSHVTDTKNPGSAGKQDSGPGVADSKASLQGRGPRKTKNKSHLLLSRVYIAIGVTALNVQDQVLFVFFVFFPRRKREDFIRIKPITN